MSRARAQCGSSAASLFQIPEKQSLAVDGVTGATLSGYVINAKNVVLASVGFLDSAEMTGKYLKNEYYPLSGA